MSDQEAPTAESPESGAPPQSKLRRAASFLVPIALGLVFFFAIRAGRKDPAKRPPTEQGRPVRVIEVQALEALPRAIGYGVVQAARDWELTAQVSGQVIEMHKDLKVGKVLKKGTQLLKIDPQNYQLTASQRRASLASVRAQIAQLNAQEKSTQANLKIEKRSLELSQRDLDRTRALFATGGVTQADVDTAERTVLQQRSTVQNLQNQLREIPANRASLNAQAKESKAVLKGASLDVSRTELIAPFTVRVRELKIQPSEIVTAGQVLAVADGVETAEVPAQLTLGALRPLLPEKKYGPAQLMGQKKLERRGRALNIDAIVTLESGDLVARWDAKVSRITTVDPTTRTIGVVVTVDQPKVRGQPPLLSGLYVQVELRGKKRPGCKAIPRGALRAGDVLYVVDAASRLVRREAKVAISQAAFVCIEEGVKVGERVVLTDVIPAVEGMLLVPRVDERSSKTLLSQVAGEGEAK